MKYRELIHSRQEIIDKIRDLFRSHSMEYRLSNAYMYCDKVGPNARSNIVNGRTIVFQGIYVELDTLNAMNQELRPFGVKLERKGICAWPHLTCPGVRVYRLRHNEPF